MKKYVMGGVVAVLGVVAPLGGMAALGSGTPAGASAPHLSLTHVLYNVPPLEGKHLLRFGLGRLRNMTQTSSTNWSGYADINDTFQTVSGSWTEPTVKCAPASGGGGLLGLGGGGSAATAYSSYWVGIDGYTSTSVEQIGTSADCLSNGQPSYYAWYEMYPAGEVQLSTTTYKVNPGDVLTASVNSPTSTSYIMTLHDVQAGWTATENLTGGNLAHSSVEWVAEAPSACNFLFCSGLPLANFGSVDFTGASAMNTAHTTGSIAGFTDAEITMQSNGTVKAVPEGLTGNGTSFIVNWSHS